MEKIYKKIPLSRLCFMVVKPYFDILSDKLKSYGIEKTSSILVVIACKKQCTQQDIGTLLNIDKVTMVKLIDLLVRKNYIKKMQNPKDRRENLIVLTKKGREVHQKIEQDIDALNNNSFKRLSKKEKENFYQAIFKIENNLKNIITSQKQTK